MLNLIFLKFEYLFRSDVERGLPTLTGTRKMV